MFRSLHVVSSLTSNALKHALGFEGATSVTECLQTIGGLYSKVSQQARILDPQDQIYNECQQVNETETRHRLVQYLNNCTIPSDSMELLATGSIGAVYRVRLPDTTFVLMKVQYVGIQDIWDQDLKMIRCALQAQSMIKTTQDPDNIMQQLDRIRSHELDYRYEMEQHLWFYQHFNHVLNMVIPVPEPQMSSDLVLVTRFLGGETLLAFLHHATQIEINQIAQRLHTFHYTSMIVYGRIYIDYHWGNLKVIDGDKIGLLDFGMVETIEPNELNLYNRCLLCAIHVDRASFHPLVQQWTVEEQESLWTMFTTLAQPYQPDFSYNEEYIKSLHTMRCHNRHRIWPGSVAVFRAELLLSSMFQYMHVTLNQREWIISLLQDHPRYKLVDTVCDT